MYSIRGQYSLSHSISLSGGGEEVIPDFLLEMFKYVEPIYKFHVGFLKEVEQRLAMWYV